MIQQLFGFSSFVFEIVVFATFWWVFGRMQRPPPAQRTVTASAAETMKAGTMLTKQFMCAQAGELQLIDGCKHKKSCCRGTVAVRQELHFQLLVWVQYQTAFSHVHANRWLQVTIAARVRREEFSSLSFVWLELDFFSEYLNSKRRFGTARRARSTALKSGTSLEIERKTNRALLALILICGVSATNLVGQLFGGTALD
jgi:hypothetical protein